MTLPTIAAESRYELAVHYLAQMFVDSAAWKAWSGTTDDSQVWEYDTAGPLNEGTRPAVVVGQSTHIDNNIAEGVQNVFEEGGEIQVIIEAQIPSGQGGDPDYRGDLGTAKRWMLNEVGKVLDDVRAFAGVAGYLNVIGITVNQVDFCAEEEEQKEGLYSQVWLQVRYRG